MFRIEILAVGKVKKGPWAELLAEYQQRMRWNVSIHEIESRITDAKAQQQDEMKQMLARLDGDSFVIVMDERGDGLRSLDFAHTLEKLGNSGISKISILIGGAEGFTEDVRTRANLLLSFGQQTWPHIMVRIMIMEQIYRAQQILANHPYHREG
jgi:23S rRNA (pseudouridine1915-N3)-methyltransferase